MSDTDDLKSFIDELGGESAINAFMRLASDPWVKISIGGYYLDLDTYGPEAMAFDAACCKKDYSILWEDMAKDRAEFNRLVAMHQATVSKKAHP